MAFVPVDLWLLKLAKIVQRSDLLFVKLLVALTDTISASIPTADRGLGEILEHFRNFGAN